MLSHVALEHVRLLLWLHTKKKKEKKWKRDDNDDRTPRNDRTGQKVYVRRRCKWRK